jgi:hypothetical protein
MNTLEIIGAVIAVVLSLAALLGLAGFLVGAAAGIDATIPIPPILPQTVAGSATFTKGILTAYTAPS